MPIATLALLAQSKVQGRAQFLKIQCFIAGYNESDSYVVIVRVIVSENLLYQSH